MQTILSGVQPSGSLHLGNLVGAIENYVRLQAQSNCKTYYMVADWHALTSRFDSPGTIAPAVNEVAATFLACGLDPDKSVLFAQSHVKEHAELHLLLSMVTPLSWVERVPTFKEKLQNSNADLGSYGFLGYPVLQAADILLSKANKVPVGEDQLFHLELTREIARRFNFLYKKETFPDPQAELNKAQKVPGLDGRKMSKTYDNGIYLRDTDEQIMHKCTRQMASDTARLRKTDPGDPDACVAHTFHKLFSTGETAQELAEQCRKAGVGCFDCKKKLAERIIERIAPLREGIEGRLEKKSDLQEILCEGAKKAREKASATMDEVRETMAFG
jgi:tryptophanyl-tRNA synthetase